MIAVEIMLLRATNPFKQREHRARKLMRALLFHSLAVPMHCRQHNSCFCCIFLRCSFYINDHKWNIIPRHGTINTVRTGCRGWLQFVKNGKESEVRKGKLGRGWREASPIGSTSFHSPFFVFSTSSPNGFRHTQTHTHIQTHFRRDKSAKTITSEERKSDREIFVFRFFMNETRRRRKKSTECVSV